jgi:hypothetical protein
MPDIQPEKKNTVERRPLPKLAMIAVRELQKNADAAMQEIVIAAGEALCLEPAEWQFDPQTLSFVKP